jgi:heme O synthase-like polyprenyltransferase
MKTAAMKISRLWNSRINPNQFMSGFQSAKCSIEVFLCRGGLTRGYRNYHRSRQEQHRHYRYVKELLIARGSCPCRCYATTNTSNSSSSNKRSTSVSNCSNTPIVKYYHSTSRILERDDELKNGKTTSLIDKREKDITLEEYTKAISELSKARLSALVVSTCSFGYLAAAVEPISYTTLAAASLGTALCSSSASTFNQIFEQDRDARMKRTAHRPLVTKRIVGNSGAYALAAGTGISGGATLYFGTDPVTTALGVGNILLYAGAYTFLKPRSEWNTWVGAIVGAIPPIMGYTAATNGMGIWDVEAALLGGTLFLWQFPHFFALSWMHRVDYARGGFQVRK